MSYRIFVDMDGVVANFDKAKKAKGLTSDEYKVLPGAYLDLEPMPDALDSLRQLMSENYEVWLATKPPTGIAHAYADKAAWVFKHIPELSRRLIITPDKGLLGDGNDWLIDDNPQKANCSKFKGILIPFINGRTWRDTIEIIHAGTILLRSI
jgi:5'-nucleotidase